MLNALTHHHCHYSYYLNTAVICLYLNPYLQLVVIIIFIIKVKVIVVLAVEVAITAAAASTTTAALLVDLGHDGVRDAFELLLLLLELLDFRVVILVEPVEGFLHRLLKFLLVLLRDLVGDALLLVVQGVAQVVRVAFQGVALVHLLLHLGVLVGE